MYEEQKGILGYRQMTITVNRRHETHFNKKRIRRLMQILHLKSVCRRKKYNYIKFTPEVTAENVLNREFYADAPDEKWLTDVTEFKYYVGVEVRKVYLSAIFDIYDRRIVSYKIGTSNNNQLVFETFDEAVACNPTAHPLFHSDRGFQYTNKTFHNMLTEAGMRQSMSRVGRCIDNGPMEGFWGILKSEMYYLRKFSSKEESHDHHFKWWFEISPIRALLQARPKGRISQANYRLPLKEVIYAYLLAWFLLPVRQYTS